MLVGVTDYLGYATAMLLIFGLTFELPLFVVILNVAGVLTHARIRKSRRMLIFGIFVFAAVATPSQDPFTMLALALPTVVLFEVAEVIAWVHDKRKAAAPTRTRACPTTRPRPWICDDDIDDTDATWRTRPALRRGHDRGRAVACPCPAFRRLGP